MKAGSAGTPARVPHSGDELAGKSGLADFPPRSSVTEADPAIALVFAIYIDRKGLCCIANSAPPQSIAAPQSMECIQCATAPKRVAAPQGVLSAYKEAVPPESIAAPQSVAAAQRRVILYKINAAAGRIV